MLEGLREYYMHGGTEKRRCRAIADLGQTAHLIIAEEKRGIA